MTILITGGSKSGKSHIAETIVTASGLPCVYLATMMPFGEEAHAAIARHRAMREGKGFVTLEQYTDIGTLDLPKGSAVLLECMGNLCANEMFSAHTPRPVQKILTDVKTLSRRCDLLVIVTNQVGEDGVLYAPETMRYIKNLGEINWGIAQEAELVIETVFGIPVMMKGEKPPCLY